MNTNDIFAGQWYLIVNPDLHDRKYTHYLQGKVIEANTSKGKHHVHLWQGGIHGRLRQTSKGEPIYTTVSSRSIHKECETPEPELGSEAWAQVELNKWEEHKKRVMGEYFLKKKTELSEILLPMLGIQSSHYGWNATGGLSVDVENIQRLNKALKLIIKHELLEEVFDTPDLPVLEYTPPVPLDFDDTQEPTTQDKEDT